MRLPFLFTLLLIVSLLVGCHGASIIHEGSKDEKTRDAVEMWSKFQQEVRDNNVGQQYHYYSATFKKRYKVFEYGLLFADPTIAGLFKRFILEWKVVEYVYAHDHKSGYILLQHPALPQYKKTLDIVLEYDEKLQVPQWRIDFGLAKFMNLPDSTEQEIIDEEEKYRQEINKQHGGGGPPPKPEEKKDEKPQDDKQKEGRHD